MGHAKKETRNELYTGSLIESLYKTVSQKMGLVDDDASPTCLWETFESAAGKCDGGFVCGRPAVKDTERCERHQEEPEICLCGAAMENGICSVEECVCSSRGQILREGLRRVGCPVLEVGR